ncbi:MAG: enoyl-CoA hydratase/isomerase family protein [Gammaproteobacteria bacterium]|nr:enoyl-CoA hydratase/isomerase family protein [Gammaproteobacteria bacterium]
MVENIEDNLLFEEIMGAGGSVGLITLNRPDALNALTLDMCIAIDDKLAEWEKMGHIKAVLVRGEGEKAFCAGGDIKYVYDQGKSGAKKSRKFFWHEYRMNRRIFHFPKPYIALMHGITMGGGVGLSVHSSHRVAAENLVFAMPETGIGFFPDVGGSYFLPRCTGNTGIYMAMTGAKLHIADAIYAGVVDHLVPKENFEALITALAETKLSGNVNMQVSDIIGSYTMDADSMDIYKPHLLEHRAEINQCFAAHTLEGILEALVKSQSDWCQIIIAKMLEKSPTSLKVTLKQLLLGSQMDFDDCMKLEYRVAQRFLMHPDFYEGIRSAIIDKEHIPAWKPDNLEELTPDIINEFFAPLKQELSFEKKAVVK